MYMLPGGVSFRTQKRRVKRAMNRYNANTRKINKKANKKQYITRFDFVRGMTARSFGIATR